MTGEQQLSRSGFPPRPSRRHRFTLHGDRLQKGLAEDAAHHRRIGRINVELCSRRNAPKRANSSRNDTDDPHRQLANQQHLPQRILAIGEEGVARRSRRSPPPGRIGGRRFARRTGMPDMKRGATHRGNTDRPRRSTRPMPRRCGRAPCHWRRRSAWHCRRHRVTAQWPPRRPGTSVSTRGPPRVAEAQAGIHIDGVGAQSQRMLDSTRSCDP